MPAIASLPAELIDQIGSYLISDDLLALRMTCNSLDALARESHLDSLYRVRTLYPVPASLENLIKISQHPSGVNERVRHLVISVSSPHVLFEDPCAVRNFAAEGPARSKILKAIKTHSEAHKDESATVSRNEGYTYLFTTALLNLPNICKISFKQELELKRHEFNLFYSSLGLKPGKRLPRIIDLALVDFLDLSSTYKNWWKSLISAVQLSGLSKLTEIRGHLDNVALAADIFQTIPISAFATKPPNFSSLKVLEMQIKAPSREAKQDWNSSFCSWLEIWGVNVVDLRLMGQLFDGITFCLPENKALARLQKLKLHGCYFDLENFQRFVTLSGRKMKELVFKSCSFEDDKNDWFQILKQIRKECLHLQYFSFLPVNKYEERWDSSDEDEDEGYDKYVLPALEVKGLWKLNDTMCKVTMETAEELAKCRLRPKHIGLELDKALTAKEFWDSMTNRFWDNPNLILTSPRGCPVEEFDFDDQDDYDMLSLHGNYGGGTCSCCDPYANESDDYLY
ncbi:hypothetical protein TWF694_006377 [Orbilia ellipsospora]|uniref:F-box domain-containing protein n=1 Tax=Orbilia ellipsospora TaxID=2528407 RepID=A0AAV9XNC5_9PEZI